MEESLKYNREKLIRIILIIAAVLTPLLIVIVSLKTVGKDIQDCAPLISDFKWWWKQAEAIGEYGKPLGYWGYNGGHAKIGTYASWGWAMPMCYGAYAALFDWNYYSFVYANILFRSIAILIFIVLTKSDNRSILTLILVNVLLIIPNGYLLLSMAESARYALAIIAAGLLWYLFKKPDCHWTIKYLLIPLYLVYISQAYVILSIFFFGYMMVILRDKKWYYNLIVSTISATMFTFISRKVIRLFCSPYISSPKPITQIMKENIGRIIYSCQNGEKYYAWFFLAYLVLSIGLIVYFILNFKRMKKDDKILYAAAIIILLAFSCGHIVIYNNLMTWSAMRGLSVALVIVSFILCLSKKKFGVVLFVLVTLMGTFCFKELGEKVFFSETKFISEDTSNHLDETREILSDVIIVNEKASSPWENTVAKYLTGDWWIDIALPVGCAVNVSMDGTLITDAKYQIIGKMVDDEQAQEIMSELEKVGFVNTFENNDMIVMVKEK